MASFTHAHSQSQQGIQTLLEAEKEAAKIVAKARSCTFAISHARQTESKNSKMQRLKLQRKLNPSRPKNRHNLLNQKSITLARWIPLMPNWTKRPTRNSQNWTLS